MIVLGLDPGSQKTGYAVLEAKLENIQIVDFGVVKLIGSKERPSLGARLEVLHNEVLRIAQQWNPRWVGFEKAVSFRNVASAFQLSEARGVVRLALHQVLDQAEDRVIELSPTRIKKLATGLGSASKGAVTRSLELRFPGLSRLTVEALPHDAYDAVAVAYSAWLEKGRVTRIHGLSGRA